MPVIFDVRSERFTTRGRRAGIVAILIAVALIGSACSGGSSSGSTAPTANRAEAVVVNHAAYRFTAARGLAWYLLPPRNKQRPCRPTCTALSVAPAFRSNVIAGVDTVPAQHRTWRLIVQLRRPAMAKLASVTKHHARGSEIVIAVGNRFLVHAPLQQPIVGGVWQISGLSRATAFHVAAVLRSIAHGYPVPKHHRVKHHHRKRHHRHRHHHHARHHHHRRHHHH